jgi:hypothetical protein
MRSPRRERFSTSARIVARLSRELAGEGLGLGA